MKPQKRKNHSYKTTDRVYKGAMRYAKKRQTKLTVLIEEFVTGLYNQNKFQEQ